MADAANGDDGGTEGTFDTTLVLAGPRARRVRVRVTGSSLVQTTSSAAGTPKTTQKDLGTAAAAREAFRKTVRKKLRDDYVIQREAQAYGDVVFEAFAGGGGGGAVLDLSRDGRLLATASITSDSNFGAKVEVVEIATGARRIVVEEPPGTHQCFLHTTLFDRAGTGLYYLLRDDTYHVDLATGERRVIALGSGFNPHVVRPCFDGDRQRLVVLAERATVRVLDAAGATLLEVSTRSPTTECRAAAISASGRLLAIYIVSRGIIYAHDNAKHDTTNEVQIWDIEAGVLWETVAMPQKVHRIGLAPDDDALIVTWDHAAGPVALAIPSGAELWRSRDPQRSSDLGRAYSWRYSPDGRLLAIASNRLLLLDAATRTEIDVPARFGRADCITFSADGSRAAIALDGTALVYALA